MIKYVFNPFTGNLDAIDVSPLQEIDVSFDYTTSGALDFGRLVAGNSVIGLQVVIDEPFNDPSTQVSIGLVSNPDGILATINIDPTTASTYSAQENFLVTASDALRLKVFPFASTQGAGRVVAIVG
jgi:hypothetical protein